MTTRRFAGGKGDVMQLTFNQTLHHHHRLRDIVHLDHEDGRMLLRIYGVRLEALAIATCLWVILTLVSGIFSVVMVILIGAAVGNAHHLLGKMPRRTHNGSAILLTLCGGIVANILAGLALYSNKLGVGYWQVLSSRRFPDDLSMLAETFVGSFRVEDGLFYALAIVIAMLSARRLSPWEKGWRHLTGDDRRYRDMNCW